MPTISELTFITFHTLYYNPALPTAQDGSLHLLLLFLALSLVGQSLSVSRFQDAVIKHNGTGDSDGGSEIT